jgi:hypothetical protein
MAVREFAECRPKGIYKQDYLDDLRKLYGDEDDELTVRTLSFLPYKNFFLL